jgi:molecular chaperone GrpE
MNQATEPAPSNENELPEDQQQLDPHAQRIAELEAQVSQMKDQWMRASAETENVRKRAERDQQETARYASAKFARDMVDVLENVKRAAESITAEKREANELLKTVGDGLDMTAQELTGIFERHGIKRVDPMGEKFDHNLHQAVVQVEAPGSEPGTVIQVVQAGYVLHDRLLRPAMVAVTKAGDAKKVDTNA